MSNRYRRRQQMKYAHITAIVVGIFIALGGLYFISVISSETNRKIARCTESAAGTVSEVRPADSGYLTTIDFDIDGSAQSVTVKSKKDLGTGTPIEVKYEPLHYSNLYIDGITQTGTHDVISGLIMILAGGVFVTTGILMKKSKAKKEQVQTEE